MSKVLISVLLAAIPAITTRSGESPNKHADTIIRQVEVSIYHATPRQTDSTPLTCSWGDVLPKDSTVHTNLRYIAVSRDLLGDFTHRDRVFIIFARDSSLNGVYYVMDKMHKRWRNKIDVLLSPHDKWIDGKATLCKI